MEKKEDWEQDLDWLMTESENAKNGSDAPERELTSTNEEIIDMPRTATDDDVQQEEEEEDEDAALGIYNDDDFDDEDDDEEDLYPVQSEEVQRNTMMNDAPESDDYDLQLKLEQANEELVNGADSDSLAERQRTIQFKPKLIDFEAPPDEHDYTTDDEAGQHHHQEEDEDTDKVSEDLNNISLNDDVVSEEMVEINGQKVKKTEKILIERDGKFELVEVSELEGILPPISNGNGVAVVNGNTLHNSNGSDVIKEVERPTSAPTQSTLTPHPPPRMHSRPRSAAPNPPNSRTHQKTFRYSAETKEIIKKRHEARMQRQKEDEKRRKAEEEMKREEADEAWKAWLETKNEEAKQRRKEERALNKEERQRKAEEQQRQHAKDAYVSWMRSKRTQIRQERIQTQQQQMEEDEKWFVRDRRDCNRAFRAWLRRKNEEAQKARESDRILRKQSRRMARQARRARKLLDALREAQEMKYIEYYGYRF